LVLLLLRIRIHFFFCLQKSDPIDFRKECGSVSQRTDTIAISPLSTSKTIVILEKVKIKTYYKNVRITLAEKRSVVSVSFSTLSTTLSPLVLVTDETAIVVAMLIRRIGQIFGEMNEPSDQRQRLLNDLYRTMNGLLNI
jgi:hypothetical protein